VVYVVEVAGMAEVDATSDEITRGVVVVLAVRVEDLSLVNVVNVVDAIDVVVAFGVATGIELVGRADPGSVVATAIVVVVLRLVTIGIYFVVVEVVVKEEFLILP